MSDEAFLARWSRLKRRHGAAAPRPPEPGVPPAAPVEAADGPAPAASLVVPVAEEVAEEGGAAAGDPLADLPPLDSLTADSDFTPFLRAGVPEDLHRRALRTLWGSDPVYANMDGMKDYADDYTGLFDGGVVVKTIYRAGKGIADALDDLAGTSADSAQDEDGPDSAGDMASTSDMTKKS